MNQVATASTTSMVMDQAVSAAASAILSASGLGATVGSPVQASLADIDAGADLAYRVTFDGGDVAVVISGGLGAALAPPEDDSPVEPSALANLIEMGGLAAAERMQSLVDGSGDRGAVELLPDGLGDMTGGEASRVDVDVNGEPFGWIMVVGSSEFVAALQPRETGATVIDAIDYPDLGQGAAPAENPTDISFLSDVTMGVTVELGRTIMRVREVLQLTQGSVIELDRAAGALVDVLISGSIVARGEVVVIDDQLGVRVVEIVDSTQ